MTGIVHHTSSTIVALLNGVSTAANTATRGITTASHGLDMLEQYVNDAKQRQLDSSKVSMRNYRKNLLLTSAQERQRTEEAIQAEMHINPTRKAHFDAIYSELESLFE